MRIIYLSNIFNHHQKPLSDSLFNTLGEGNYFFVETQVMEDEQKNLGYLKYSEPYIIQINDDTIESVKQMIQEFDVVICGEAPLYLVKDRYKTKKITIRDDESRYKGIIKYLKWPIYSYASFTYNKGYLLCASAFGPADYLLSGMSPRKVFRWGYFPEVIKYDTSLLTRRKEEYRLKHQLDVSILWVGRLIGWKHPESTIILARFLKRHGISFLINILGRGPKEGMLRSQIEKYNLHNEVKLIGAVPSDQVREYMLEADISLITSDRREGWGAVVNETMNSGCAVVACENVGAVPYLIEPGFSGLTFRDCDWTQMNNHVLKLVENPTYRTEIGKNAYDSMVNTWNAERAAENLLSLIKSIQDGTETAISAGPCSPAPIKFRTSKFGFPTL